MYCSIQTIIHKTIKISYSTTHLKSIFLNIKFTHHLLFWMWTVQISFQWQRHIKDTSLLTDAKFHICAETQVPVLSQLHKTGLFPRWTLAPFPAPRPCCLPSWRRYVPVSKCHSQYTTHSFKQLHFSCSKGLHVTTAEEMTKKIKENSFLETLSFDSWFI